MLFWKICHVINCLWWVLFPPKSRFSMISWIIQKAPFVVKILQFFNYTQITTAAQVCNPVLIIMCGQWTFSFQYARNVCPSKTVRNISVAFKKQKKFLIANSYWFDRFTTIWDSAGKNLHKSLNTYTNMAHCDNAPRFSTGGTCRSNNFSLEFFNHENSTVADSFDRSQFKRK